MLNVINLVVCGSLNGPTLGHFVVHYVFPVLLQLRNQWLRNWVNTISHFQ